MPVIAKTSNPNEFILGTGFKILGSVFDLLRKYKTVSLFQIVFQDWLTI